MGQSHGHVATSAAVCWPLALLVTTLLCGVTAGHGPLPDGVAALPACRLREWSGPWGSSDTWQGNRQTAPLCTPLYPGLQVVVHQPSIDIFLSFDELLLLQLGDRVTYFGPLGTNAEALIQYLETQPGVEALQPGHNPGTWMLEVTGGSIATTYRPSALADFPSLYDSSELRAANDARMERLIREGAASQPTLQLASRYAASAAMQRRWLVWKYARWAARCCILPGTVVWPGVLLQVPPMRWWSPRIMSTLDRLTMRLWLLPVQVLLA